MAKSVYYSFHYDHDVWRVQTVWKIGAVEAQPLLSGQDWEKVKARGDAAIERWIDEQMAYKRAVVVLVGAETASRRWVLYEIAKAWNEKKPLVGIRIHRLKDAAGNTDYAGADPFAAVPLKGGGTIADYVTLHDPAGATSQDIFASIRDNIESWVDGAFRRS